MVHVTCVGRWFIVDDVDMLEDDVQLLKGLFDADGEGLSRQRIDELCAPLTAALVVMQLDTGILVANYKQVHRLDGNLLLELVSWHLPQMVSLAPLCGRRS